MTSFLAYVNLWVEIISEAKHASRTYFELSQLSNKDLNELGIDRSEIAAIAFNASQKMKQ